MSYYSINTGDKTAYNEVYTTSPRSFVEGSFNYGLIPANFRQFTASGGSTGTEGRFAKVSTGTSSGGYGAIQSFRTVPGKIGKGVSSKFSGYFASNVANSWQGIGLLSIGEEMSFGYNGTSFGVWHRYGGLPEVRTITVTGAAGADTDLTLTLNGVAYTIPLTTGTTAHNAYEIAAWLNNTSNQAVWGADQLDSTVIISALSDGAKTDTYSFSHATATGTIAQNREGVTKTSEHIPQTQWDNVVFTDFDPSNGNLYEIQYQNMGFGEIVYSIMNPNTGRYQIVHRIKNPNRGTTLHIPNPSMRIGCYCVSISSTTNLDVYLHAIEASLDGADNRTRNPRSFKNTVTLSTGDITNILALRNRKTYNSYNNQVIIYPLKVTLASELNKNATFEIRASQMFSQELQYTTAGTNLVGDISTTASNVSGGRLIDSVTVAPSGDKVVDLQDIQLSLPPGLQLVIDAQRAGGGSSGDVTATLTWYEDL